MAEQITVCPLRSGSSGNSLFISNNKTSILLDAGTSGRTIETALQSLGHDPAALDAIVVTHEHTDHVAGVGVLMRKYKLPLFVNQPTWQAMAAATGQVDPDLINLIDRESEFALGDFVLSSFATPHDAVASAGYRVKTGAGDITLMTDLGQMTPELVQQAAGSKVVVIEANYDQAMLESGPYPEPLKERVSSQLGHLSNAECAQAVAQLLELGTDHFILSHLSKENNYPELALLTVGRYLNRIKARPQDTKIKVARRFAVSEPLCL
jgi:phosphoribosyl 1,2-cyclic phosphodiesterase